MEDIFTRGIVLAQHKEPALSRDLQEFTSPGPSALMEREPAADPDALTAEEIITIAKEAGIIDESDGMPLWEKLRQGRSQGISVLAVDAIDDEPYISSQLCPAIQLGDQMAGGARLAQKALGAQESFVAIYKHLMDVETKIPQEIAGLPVHRITGGYPAEYRANRQLQDKNTLLLGAWAMIHLWRAVYQNRKQDTCFVTVAGNCIANPMNLEVTIGMTAMQLLERCGLAQNPTRIVAGGSMMGYGVLDPEKTLVGPTTRGLNAFREYSKHVGYTCIGCGRCTKVCPQGLSPYYLYQFITRKKMKYIDRFDLERCIGCGTCSYVCPAKLDLSTIIFTGKVERLAKAGKEVTYETDAQ